MITEIIGGTHIERPSEPTEAEKLEKTTNTILIMNAEVRRINNLIPDLYLQLTAKYFPYGMLRARKKNWP